jgi:hypothetical protein
LQRRPVLAEIGRCDDGLAFGLTRAAVVAQRIERRAPEQLSYGNLSVMHMVATLIAPA